MARKKATNNYIDNVELHYHLSQYIHAYRAAKAAKQPLPKIPEYAGKAIKLIATNLATKSNFGGYSFREDMIGDGIENCLRYLHNFDPDKPNAFGYLTFIMFRAFVRRIQTESKESYIKHKMILNNSDFFDTIANEMASHMLDSVSLEKSSEIVRNYEEKQDRKKEKMIERKLLKEAEENE